ncbi:Caulimovirus viroplasmin-domain-containing protein [Catenaria anguillulae PL171]|uniref:Ribonuclease H n=1 Tax=Catenaria anguillulae PL171 TaxID=765915 RepID=A0A1Y2HCJ8_9FUNG|nr:Caulimovirus viroplasmin-domain-containing protein [Catenaria anguillulae PL171]
MGKSSKKKFYAVHKGHQTGVFEKWSEVDPLVKGFAGARYKGFETKSEAEHFAKHGRELPAGSRSAAEAVKEVIQVKKSGPMKAAGSSGKMKQVPMYVAAAAMASASAATSAPGSPTLSRSALLQFTSGKVSMAQAEQIPLPQPKLFAVSQPSSPVPPLSSAGPVPSSPPQSSVTAVPVSPTLIPRDRLDPNTIVVSAPPKLPHDADIMSHIADANPLLPPSSRALKSAFDRAIEVDGVPPATLAGQREVPFLEYELQPGWLKVYTDGSCFGNGKGVKVAKAGMYAQCVLGCSAVNANLTH